MKDLNKMYRDQVDLLLRILPYIAKEEDLALKGGTAINMFIWDMPRLSVDIDLVYIPIDDREAALKNISNCIMRLKNSISKGIPNIIVTSLGVVEEQEVKLSCALKGVVVKIEINTVMRGTIKPVKIMLLTEAVQNEFARFADIQVVSKGELFGGKICAALDRQHPRDLFDINHLLKEGISDEIKQGFLAALLSHPRPINEMLKPNFSNQKEVFANQFIGMALKPFSYEDFTVTRERLISEVHKILSRKDKELLISFKAGEPDWNLNQIEHLKDLPAVKWKLMNIQKLLKNNPIKHEEQLNKLRLVLGNAG